MFSLCYNDFSSRDTTFACPGFLYFKNLPGGIAGQGGSDPERVLDNMPAKSAIDDLIHQINKLVTTANILLERFARGYEEIDSNRLALEEIRELLNEHFNENARWADILSKRMDRVEQYTILSKIGDSRAGEITQQVTGEHIRRTLREELGTQQELLQQYQINIDRVKLRMAKYGETVPLLNEMDDYVREIAKVTEAIDRIREALNK